jgi:hypothetical protein
MCDVLLTHSYHSLRPQASEDAAVSSPRTLYAAGLLRDRGISVALDSMLENPEENFEKC